METYGVQELLDRNYALCRKSLDRIFNGNFRMSNYERSKELQFFKVNGVTRFWEESQEAEIGTLTGDILNSCIQHDIPFAYAVVGDENGINIYIGTLKILREGLKSSYESVFPGIDIDLIDGDPLITAPRECGGMFTGIPTDKSKDGKREFQIESICRGMRGKRFTYVVLATGISKGVVTYGHDHLLDEMAKVFPMINQTVSGGAQGNLSAQKQDFYSKNYFENLEVLERMLKMGEARGMWYVNGYYASDNPTDAGRLGSIIKAGFSGEESGPEPFRVLKYNSIGEVIANTYFLSDKAEDYHLHPLGCFEHPREKDPILFYVYKYRTVLDSDRLATLCQLPTREFSGYYVDDYVEFDVSNRVRESLKQPVKIGDVCVAGRKGTESADNPYLMEKDDFTRHALIIGVTGGGKTNTAKSVLSTLWNTENPADRIPFLVIESAKREYWELRNVEGFEDLLVFTLGAEASDTSVRYRINPFEVCPGISLQTHIDYLLSAFKAAFDLQPPLPYILESAVYEIYTDRGWDIVENRNRYGLTEYPTLADLYHKIDILVDRLGYHQEVQSNVKTALRTRIYSLMIGGKGAMMNTPKSVPIEELLNRPVVMELEDLGDDETKSFVIGLLLVQLYEYRKSGMTKGSRQLSHILMVEEAHRLLRNVSDTKGSTREKSVEFFCNLLAEIRTFGQGIIISDQIPTKLASDTIKNTNLKIVHRTVAEDDRDTIGRAMNMSKEQIDYLSSLRRGYAAVYSEGDNRPKCVKIPLVETVYEKDRREVLWEVKRNLSGIAKGYDTVINRHAACAFCEHRCKYFERVSAFVTRVCKKEIVAELWKNTQFDPKVMDSVFVLNEMRNYAYENDFERRCILGYILEGQKDLEESRRKQIMVDYLKYKYDRV